MVSHLFIFYTYREQTIASFLIRFQCKFCGDIYFRRVICAVSALISSAISSLLLDFIYFFHMRSLDGNTGLQG